MSEQTQGQDYPAEPGPVKVSQWLGVALTVLTIFVMAGGVILATGKLSERIATNGREIATMQKQIEDARAERAGKMDIELYKVFREDINKRLDRLENKIDQLLAGDQHGG